MDNPLKLFADDHDGLAVISTMLQDALVPLNDMEFLQVDASFVLAINRFCWERPEGQNYRTHCGLRIDGVTAVRGQNLDRSRGDVILEILSISFCNTDDGQPAESLELHFSGGGVLRLLGTQLSCGLQDMGEAWPTKWRPNHVTD